MIDFNFALDLTNQEHGLICLRQETLCTGENFQFADLNRYVQFFHPFFDLDPWRLCPMRFVRIPHELMTIVQSGKSLQAAIQSLQTDTHRFIAQSLIHIFKSQDVSNDGTIEELDGLISLVIAAKQLDSIPFESRQKIDSLIVEDLDSIYGYFSDEQDEYFKKIRQELLLIT
jgi:hypothetical protein